MRLNAERHVVRESGVIRGEAEGSGGVITNGDVVGVAVESVQPEGEDHLGTEATNFKHQAGHHFVLAGLNECLGMVVVVPAGHTGITVLEDLVGLDAQFLDSLSQLSATYLADGLAGGGARLTDFAEFAGSGGNQPRGHSPCRVHRDGPADGEGLVVGVGEQDEKTMIGHDCMTVKPVSGDGVGANAHSPLRKYGSEMKWPSRR